MNSRTTRLMEIRINTNIYFVAEEDILDDENLFSGLNELRGPMEENLENPEDN